MIARDRLALGEKPAPGDLAFVQGFVNTLDVESGTDAFDTPAGLAAWLRRHGFLEAGAGVDEAARRRAVAVREGLRALLYGHAGGAVDAGALAPLRAASAEETVRFVVDDRGGVRPEPAAAGVEGAVAWLLAVVSRAEAEGTWSRLKACREETCQWAFFDAAKNRSGTWCSMEVCGSRAKARAYRRRHRGSAVSGSGSTPPEGTDPPSGRS